MEETKKCFSCNRFYRGDGHKGHCTSSCWSSDECRKREGKEPKTAKRLHEKREIPKDTIKEANERWINKKMADKATLKKMLEGRAKYEVKCLYGDGVSNRFKAVRG